MIVRNIDSVFFKSFKYTGVYVIFEHFACSLRIVVYCNRHDQCTVGNVYEVHLSVIHRAVLLPFPGHGIGAAFDGITYHSLGLSYIALNYSDSPVLKFYTIAKVKRLIDTYENSRCSSIRLGK